MRLAFVLRLAAAVVLLGSTGCNPGGSTSKPNTPGQSGSGSSLKGKIEGKWAALAGSFRGKKVAAGEIKLELEPSGAFVFHDGADALNGKYSLADDTITFNFDGEFRGQKTLTEKASVTTELLTITDSDGSSLGFDKWK
jgi:hypothetical protein